MTAHGATSEIMWMEASWPADPAPAKMRSAR